MTILTTTGTTKFVSIGHLKFKATVSSFVHLASGLKLVDGYWTHLLSQSTNLEVQHLLNLMLRFNRSGKVNTRSVNFVTERRGFKSPTAHFYLLEMIHDLTVGLQSQLLCQAFRKIKVVC